MVKGNVPIINRRLKRFIIGSLSLNRDKSVDEKKCLLRYWMNLFSDMFQQILRKKKSKKNPKKNQRKKSVRNLFILRLL